MLSVLEIFKIDLGPSSSYTSRLTYAIAYFNLHFIDCLMMSRLSHIKRISHYESTRQKRSKTWPLAERCS